MAHEDVAAGLDGGRPRRRSHWRAAVVSGIVVIGAATAAPVVYGAADGPAKDTPAPMMGHMTGSGQTMGPGQMMPGILTGAGPMLDPAQMADMMKSGQHMMDMGSMTGGGSMMNGSP